MDKIFAIKTKSERKLILNDYCYYKISKLCSREYSYFSILNKWGKYDNYQILIYKDNTYKIKWTISEKPKIGKEIKKYIKQIIKFYNGEVE